MIEYNRFDFFPKIQNLSINKILEILSEDILEQRIEDKSLIIKDLSSTINLKNNSILFLSERLKINNDYKFKSIFIITNEKRIFDDKNNSNIILIKNINYSIIKIFQSFFWVLTTFFTICVGRIMCRNKKKCFSASAESGL